MMVMSLKREEGRRMRNKANIMINTHKRNEEVMIRKSSESVNRLKMETCSSNGKKQMNQEAILCRLIMKESADTIEVIS